MILGTDINPYACKAALRTASENDVQLDAIRGYLLNTLKPAWGKVDVLVFNPPYVPTDHTEYVQVPLSLIGLHICFLRF